MRPSNRVSAASDENKASVVRPGEQTTNVRPSNSDNNNGGRPGVNGHPGNGNGNFGGNPGGNSVRPDGPGYNHDQAQNSLRRPGTTYRPGPRPNYDYARPNYRPPRPHGGYWGAPPMNPFRPPMYFPPMPPRVTYVSYGVPTIGTILGLTFGSFIDAGINVLFNSGYNVLGYANNAVYLGNVSHFGYIWPETTVYYTDGLMSNTQFQSWSQTPDQWRFNNLYRQLVNTYGAPVQANTYNGITTASWWAGNNTGYITLQYGPGLGNNGLTNYYTTLTYGDGYDY